MDQFPNLFLLLLQALEAAEKAGAAVYGEEGAACGKTAGEAAARDIAARLGRDLGELAGEVKDDLSFIICGPMIPLIRRPGLVLERPPGLRPGWLRL